LISKSANLKPISKNNKVRTVRVSYSNPAFNELNDIFIRTATTYPGFCKYHDKRLFEPIENKRIQHYTGEHFLLLCLRVAVQRRYISRRENEKANKILSSRNEVVLQKMLKETTLHNFGIYCAKNDKKQSKLRYLIYAIKIRLSFYFETKAVEKYAAENYSAYNNLSNALLKAVKNRAYSAITFKQYSIKTNKIALSLLQYIPLSKNDLFIFLFVLPNTEGSHILIGCLKEQYELLQEDNFISQCFEGDINQIQKLIMLYKDEIIFNGNYFDDYEYIEQMFKTNSPLAEIFPPDILK